MKRWIAIPGIAAAVLVAACGPMTASARASNETPPSGRLPVSTSLVMPSRWSVATFLVTADPVS